MQDIVYNMIFLADLGDYQAMNEVYGSYFPENPPARACVQAGLVRPEFLVEIAATAVRRQLADFAGWHPRSRACAGWHVSPRRRAGLLSRQAARPRTDTGRGRPGRSR